MLSIYFFITFNIFISLYCQQAKPGYFMFIPGWVYPLRYDTNRNSEVGRIHDCLHVTEINTSQKHGQIGNWIVGGKPWGVLMPGLFNGNEDSETGSDQWPHVQPVCQTRPSSLNAMLHTCSSRPTLLLNTYFQRQWPTVLILSSRFLLNHS